jgi:hypothetical protein
MKQRIFYLLVFICFSVLISSAGHLKTDCKYTACMKKRMQQEKDNQKTAAKNSSDFLFPFNSVFSLW